MRRFIAFAFLPAALLPLATPARACPPVAPAQAFGAGMGYGAPVAVAPAMGSYGLNVGINPGLGAAYAPPVVAGFGAAPLYGSSGLGFGGYGVSSVGAFGAVPVGGLVQNRALIVNGRPGLFQRRLIRRQLRRGF